MPLKDPIARAAYDKQYRKDRREEILKHKKQYNKDHREERKQYYKDHREEILVYKKQYHKDHREEIKVYKKQYRKENREKNIVYAKQYHKDHPEADLRSKKKRLTELGKTFDMDYEPFRYALMSWSKTVRKRDNSKCTWCDSTQNLVSHHIWHKAFCPESALDVDNGITLCHDCHMEQHRLDRL